jgi:hypothetical protein
LTELEPTSPAVTPTEDFGSIAQNPSGAVLVAVPYVPNGGPTTTIAVFRYTPGVGWDTETAATEGDSLASRCRIAWFASDEAVVVYLYSGIGEFAALYSNGAWSSGPAIPGGLGTYFPGIATAPNGDVVLGMTSQGTELDYGTVATWLEP